MIKTAVSISKKQITQTVMNPVNVGVINTTSVMDSCATGEVIHIPTTECDECESLSLRIRALENKLETLTEISFSKTDKNSTISGVFLGRIN